MSTLTETLQSKREVRNEESRNKCSQHLSQIKMKTCEEKRGAGWIRPSWPEEHFVSEAVRHERDISNAGR